VSLASSSCAGILGSIHAWTRFISISKLSPPFPISIALRNNCKNEAKTSALVGDVRTVVACRKFIRVVA